MDAKAIGTAAGSEMPGYSYDSEVLAERSQYCTKTWTLQVCFCFFMERQAIRRKNIRCY